MNCPVTLTPKFACPNRPLTGFTDNRIGVPAVTVNPLGNVSTSAPVVKVMVLRPVAAAGSTFNTAVALVDEFTVSDATAIPAPKFAVVVPCAQFVS